MNYDSYFAYGLKVFLIVTAVTTVFCMIIWLSVEKKIERYNLRHPGHEVPTRFISSAVRFAFFLIGLLIVMSQVNPLKPMVQLIFNAGSVVMICCTFAARESFSNYIAGFLLSIHKPFKIGDMICLRDKEIAGTVEEITFRHTVIITEEGSTVTVPNAVMNSIAIEDLSLMRN